MPDISSFAALLDAFAVVGHADSLVLVVRFPAPDSVAAIASAARPAEPFSSAGLAPAPVAPILAAHLGKCSHHAVAALTPVGLSLVAAAAGQSLVLWDIVKGQRARSLTVPDYATTCTAISSSLLAVAGHGCLLHVYDVRSSKAQGPAWSVKVLADNLYSLAVAGRTVYLGGADGRLHGVDLRAQKHHQWGLPAESAISDVCVSNDLVVCLMESGVVCCVDPSVDGPGVSFGADGADSMPEGAPEGAAFRFSTQVLPRATNHRIGCDVLTNNNAIRFAAGSEDGHVCYFEYSSMGCTTPVHIPLASLLVPYVAWGPMGLFASSGADLSLLPYA